MSTTPVAPSLSDAITAVENASSAFKSAAMQTANDEAQADALQKKADDAKAVVQDDKTKQASAGSDYVSSLQTLKSAIDAEIAAIQPA